MQIPDYLSDRIDDNRVLIRFDPPVTKAALGVPFSYLVLQQKSTEVDTTRFGRVIEVRCEPGKWVSYLRTSGVPEERIKEFKDSVGYTEPEPPCPEGETEEQAAGAQAKAEPKQASQNKQDERSARSSAPSQTAP